MKNVTVQATLSGRGLRDYEGNINGRVVALWCWDPDDPLAVLVDFGDGCIWLIDRALLVHGGGIPGADIRVERSAHRVLTVLTGDEGTTEISWLRDEVDALLAGAERLIPLAEPVPEHVIDAAIAAMLSQRAPWWPL